MLDVKAVRKDFPILSREVYGKPLVYLDNAATSQKPTQVIQALVEFYERYNSNIHRGVHALSMEATEKYEEARQKCADFIGSPSAGEPGAGQEHHRGHQPGGADLGAAEHRPRR